jgi:hypothetical protein
VCGTGWGALHLPVAYLACYQMRDNGVVCGKDSRGDCELLEAEVSFQGDPLALSVLNAARPRLPETKARSLVVNAHPQPTYGRAYSVRLSTTRTWRPTRGENSTARRTGGWLSSGVHGGGLSSSMSPPSSPSSSPSSSSSSHRYWMCAL